MKKIIFVIFTLFLITIPVSYSQTKENELNMELIVTDEQRILLFVGFIVAIIAIFLYLARDIIRKKKTDYDKGEFESKQNKDYEKYHSDWSDDYEDFGSRKYSKEDKEFRESLEDNALPDYYKILDVKYDATQDEIKKQYRILAKQTHPDKTKEETEEKMIEINKAYEILSDEDLRKKYDRYFKVS